jgi:hypothetical protein
MKINVKEGLFISFVNHLEALVHLTQRSFCVPNQEMTDSSLCVLFESFTFHQILFSSVNHFILSFKLLQVSADRQKQ